MQQVGLYFSTTLCVCVNSSLHTSSSNSKELKNSWNSLVRRRDSIMSLLDSSWPLGMFLEIGDSESSMHAMTAPSFQCWGKGACSTVCGPKIISSFFRWSWNIWRRVQQSLSHDLFFHESGNTKCFVYLRPKEASWWKRVWVLSLSAKHLAERVLYLCYMETPADPRVFPSWRTLSLCCLVLRLCRSPAFLLICCIVKLLLDLDLTKSIWRWWPPCFLPSLLVLRNHIWHNFQCRFCIQRTCPWCIAWLIPFQEPFLCNLEPFLLNFVHNWSGLHHFSVAHS